MRTRLAGQLLMLLVVVGILTAGVASAQDRGAAPAPGGAQAAGRGGRGGGGLAMLTVTSTSFPDGAEIPAKYAGGQGVSPQLSWSGAPMSTTSFVLIMHDVDVAIPAGNLNNDITHWVVWNIPASATSIPESGPVPSGANQISMRGPQYMGPAPPAGAPVPPLHLSGLRAERPAGTPGHCDTGGYREGDGRQDRGSRGLRGPRETGAVTSSQAHRSHCYDRPREVGADSHRRRSTRHGQTLRRTALSDVTEREAGHNIVARDCLSTGRRRARPPRRAA